MMKINKNKIVFGTILGIVIIFIVTYSMMVFQEDTIESLDANRIPIPELQEQQKEYKSKLDAINSLKEVKQRNAPSIYDERLLDSSGVFDLDLIEKEKQRIVDSVYNQGNINYAESNYRISKSNRVYTNLNKSIDDSNKNIHKNSEKKIQESHQIFFLSDPNENEKQRTNIKTDGVIYVVVNGDQVVKTHSRLEMRLIKPAFINNELLPKNTYLYGFITFKPNRAMIHITNIHHKPVSLKAFDLQDGNEGIYVVNNFKTDVSNAIVNDVIGNINIPGAPSVGVIKSVFQRSGRKVKVKITNNYKLILKPEL